MMTRNLVYTMGAILILGVLATSSTGAVMNPRRTTYLSFSKPVHLPGVSLGAGTYKFELPDPDHAWEVVRVTSRDGSLVYFTAFTRVVDRPAGMPSDQSIIFGEGPANAPTPIKSWYPQDERTGRQFIY
jgi:hypothetical protein